MGGNQDGYTARAITSWIHQDQIKLVNGLWKIDQTTIQKNSKRTSATGFLLGRPAGTW